MAHALREVIANALAIAEAACEIVHKASPRKRPRPSDRLAEDYAAAL